MVKVYEPITRIDPAALVAEQRKQFGRMPSRGSNSAASVPSAGFRG